MKKEIMTYSLLLLVGLAGAFIASEKGDETTSQKIAVYTINPKSISSVEYREKDLTVIALRSGETEHGPIFELTTKEEVKKKAKKKDPHAHMHEEGDEHDDDMESEEASAETANIETKESYFIASSSKMKSWLENFAPLYADRKLEDITKDKWGDFGITDESPVLKISRSDGKTNEIRIGMTNFGSDQRFALLSDKDQSTIYVLDGVVATTIKKARSRLFEKNFLSFPESDLKEVVFDQGSKNIALTKKMDEQSAKNDWVDPDGKNNSANINYNNLIDKITDLKITDYLKKTEFNESEFQLISGIAFKSKEHADTVKIYKKSGSDKDYIFFIDSLNSYVKVPSQKMITVEKDLENLYNM